MFELFIRFYEASEARRAKRACLEAPRSVFRGSEGACLEAPKERVKASFEALQGRVSISASLLVGLFFFNARDYLFNARYYLFSDALIGVLTRS